MPVASNSKAATACAFSLVNDHLRARGGDNRLEGPLDDVLIQAALLIEQPKRGFEPVDQRAALGVRETLVIDPSQAIHNPHVSGLGQERGVVHKAPQRQETVEAAGVSVVAEQAGDPYHRTISISTGSC